MKGRILVGVLGLVAFIGVLAVLQRLGFPLLFTLAWAVLIVAVALIARQHQGVFEEAWPPERSSPRWRGSEVSRLAWTINARTGVAGHTFRRRVNALLRHRLTAHGLDIDDPEHYPAIDALLGQGIRETAQRKELRRADIDRLLDAVQRLSPPQEEK